MLPCKGCAYREPIPGDAHSRCVYRWPSVAAMPPGSPHGIRNGWYAFPFNFDPVWGPDTCDGRSDTRDPARVMPPNPLADVLMLLGRRL